jgi:hypothetical protein
MKTSLNKPVYTTERQILISFIFLCNFCFVFPYRGFSFGVMFCQYFLKPKGLPVQKSLIKYEIGKQMADTLW